MDGKEKSVWSRRDFLKDLGLVSLLFAAGCSLPPQSACAAPERTDKKDGIMNPSSRNGTPPAVPSIDRWAPLRFETATFALG